MDTFTFISTLVGALFTLAGCVFVMFLMSQHSIYYRVEKRFPSLQERRKLRLMKALEAGEKPRVFGNMFWQKGLHEDNILQTYSLRGVVFVGPAERLWEGMHPHEKLTYLRHGERNTWGWEGLNCSSDKPQGLVTLEDVRVKARWRKHSRYYRLPKQLAVMDVSGYTHNLYEITSPEQRADLNQKLLNVARLVEDGELTAHDLHNLYYHSDRFQEDIQNPTYQNMPTAWIKKLEGLPEKPYGVFHTLRSEKHSSMSEAFI